MPGAFALALQVAMQIVPVYEEPSHRPVFTNAEVRVLNVVLAPRVRSLLHTHANDLVGVTIVPGPLRTQALGEVAADEATGKPGDVWFESFPKPVTHWGMNLGEVPIQYLVIEFLRAIPAATSHLSTQAGGSIVFENERVRVSRIRLGAGEFTGRHAHAVGFVLGSLSSGEVTSDVATSTSKVSVSPGFVFWHDAVQEHALRNAGERPLELFEFEVIP